jgi:hypothetical protein
LHGGGVIRWWTPQQPGAAPREATFGGCAPGRQRERMRWAVDGSAEVFCPYKLWRFDGARLRSWDVPKYHTGNFRTDPAILPGHRIATCESPTPHGGSDPHCFQYRDSGQGYSEICRDDACAERAYGGSHENHHYLSGRRVLLYWHRLEVWDQRNGRRLFRIGDQRTYDFTTVVSPNSRVALTVIDDEGIEGAGTRGAALWSLGDGRRLAGIPGRVTSGAVSPDGKRVAVWAGAQIRIFAIAPLRLLRTQQVRDPVSTLAWSEDGRALFAGDVKDRVERLAAR